MTRSALRRLVWESLPWDRRLREGDGRQYVMMPAEGRYAELEGLTEAELLGLLPPAVREEVTARLNGETVKPQLAKTRAPAMAAGPGPRKGVPSRADRRRRKPA